MIKEAQSIEELGMIFAEAEADTVFIWNSKRVGKAIMLRGWLPFCLYQFFES